MKEPLVSVIIPAYNTATYINDMLHCVTKQTYSKLEIIVINDGSSDQTLEICQQVAMECDKIKIVSIPNGGVSNARNIGIDMCQGEKIFFWDSDDNIVPETIEKCLRFSEEHSVKSVLYGYANSIDGVRGNQHKSVLRSEYRGREIVDELMPHFLGHSFNDVNSWIKGECSMREGKEHTALWRIMLDAETIKNNNLRFDLNLSLGEDTKFINEYMLYEISIGYIDECLYYLTIRQDGANRTSINNPEKRLKDKEKLIWARADIDNKARRLYGVETHKFWEGTLVFSAVEMAMRLSKNTKRNLWSNYRLYKNFLSNNYVMKGISEFHPRGGVKSIPFRMLEKHLEFPLFVLCSLFPQSIFKYLR